MNRKEFTETLNRSEAFLNKLPSVPEGEKASHLMEVERGLREIRRVGTAGSRLKGAAERLFPAVRKYVVHPNEQQRKEVFTEFGTLRFYAQDVPE